MEESPRFRDLNKKEIRKNCVAHLDVFSDLLDEERGVGGGRILGHQVGVEVVIVNPVITAGAECVQGVADDVVASLRARDGDDLGLPVFVPHELVGEPLHILHK